VILFFELSTDADGIRFPDGHSLQKVIGECTGFVFYVTDRGSSYLLSFNDHDMVQASGSMSQRLKEMLGE
jgi:hypothetical protein